MEEAREIRYEDTEHCEVCWQDVPSEECVYYEKTGQIVCGDCLIHGSPYGKEYDND